MPGDWPANRLRNYIRQAYRSPLKEDGWFACAYIPDGALRVAAKQLILLLSAADISYDVEENELRAYGDTIAEAQASLARFVKDNFPSLTL